MHKKVQDYVQQTITTEKQENLKNRNGKKNNSIDSASDKLARLLTRRLRYG